MSWQSRPASGEEASGSEARGHRSTRALRLSIACGRGMRVQAGGAFDNINNKPDVKGKVLSEGAPYAPPRRYRKPRLAASARALSIVCISSCCPRKRRILWRLDDQGLFRLFLRKRT